ncbi:MAG: HesB/IscA family protein, partial [Candidatus Binatus sp.]
LSYNIRFDTQPRERDRIFQFADVRVFVDPKSFIYLHGMTLDYQETLMQQGFVFVNSCVTRSAWRTWAASQPESAAGSWPRPDSTASFGSPR